MPRTISTDCAGCPPIRAITSDVLGLLKVVESHGTNGKPQVVDRWGVPDPSRYVLGMSFANLPNSPRLAVARKNGEVEVLTARDGTVKASTKIVDANGNQQLNGSKGELDPIVGLHLFKRRGNTFAACTEKGNVSLNSFLNDDALDNSHVDNTRTWSLDGSGTVCCFTVNESESHSIIGGKGVEISVWDLNDCRRTWLAKAPPLNSLRIYTPPWFTAATFLEKDDHRKVVAGTCQHEVRLYDISAQRRPVRTIDFRESPIKVVTADWDGNTIYAGNGAGDLVSFDIRTGKLIGSFIGKCCGSIKSIVKHPELPFIASCGLDPYLRFWDAKTRQLLATVFLKQEVTSVLFDPSFVAPSASVEPNEDLITTNEIEDARDERNLKRSEQDDLEHREVASKKTKSKSKRHATD